jgi:hypothetical protein
VPPRGPRATDPSPRAIAAVPEAPAPSHRRPLPPDLLLARPLR